MSKLLPVTYSDVVRAADAIRGAIIETRFQPSRTLSTLLDAEIWLKFENLQFTASYKERGALNKLLSLTEAERNAGVIAMSAGNHAQGVAYHAHRLGIPATIVMPASTPTIKVENTRGHGATVLLEGQTLEDASQFAVRYGQEHGLTFVHPFNDPVVIAGQGTVALEMLKATPDLDTLIVPIGGGGLISGMAIAAKAINPKIKVVGVEAQLYPSMLNAVKKSSLPVGGDTLAEGIAVTLPGDVTKSIIEELVDDILLVSEADIERAVALLINIEKTVVEGAGAAGLAALLAAKRLYKDRKIGLVLCGGNIDTRLLASVLTREMAREGRLSRLSIDLPDRPGQLARVSGLIGGVGANILEVYHQRIFTDVPAKGTELNLVIETRDRAHLDQVVAGLKGGGYSVLVKGSGSGAL
ncbi:threonine dehydratase [Hyphomicrobium denitrificans ATCC 51888]|uniref:Threonine dehydratase n=1 Tax=Hyphomicrobium denitrificans (strain ATCC 51888 / DSM 1869 / NCIMB 11706 / TK 0415) TaxID=582899 RepID=D8JZ57_HYPDA|nr:threonine ammonia-lyase [Hyphomicrobium denitrificans]ADJ23659.1 threonine dehydratase [Hyphomicrobium denitrificans ATCC 51888]